MEQSLFVWGFGKYGQLGNGENENKGLPQHITFEKGTKPVTVSCGGHHTLVRLEKKQNPAKDDSMIVKIASCGRGSNGRLGNGSETDQNRFCPMKEPTVSGSPESEEYSYLKAFGYTSKDPLMAAAGHWHSAYLTMGGDLYIWGYNKAHGVLGVAGLPPIVSVPTHVPMKIRFHQVSCGFNYTLAVSESNMAYSWGCGRNGVLGQGDEEDRTTPTPIMVSIVVTQVNAGYCHSAFITVEGRLYTCGKGKDGALCQGANKQNELTPTFVKSLMSECVRSVSCSQGEHHSHTLIATDNGVYTCGDGYKGKLGLGDENSVDIPTKIPSHYFEDCLVTSVSAGGIHSAAVAPDAGLFVWGCGSDGRLGLPEAIGHRYLFRSNVPRKVDLGQWRPSHVSCSYYHTAVICRK